MLQFYLIYLFLNLDFCSTKRKRSGHPSRGTKFRSIFYEFLPQNHFYTFLSYGVTSIFGVKTCIRRVKFSQKFENLKKLAPQTQFFTLKVRKFVKTCFWGKNLKNLSLLQNFVPGWSRLTWR